MATPDYLSAPDEHLSPRTAASYDEEASERFAPEIVRPAVEFLAALAGHGLAVEFAVGTGRIALPLAKRGVPVHGIDLSGPMLTELRRKDGTNQVAVTLGDMTETHVTAEASLVYLVFNTITNLRTQEQQVACFRNAAAHLAPGGHFVIENGLPKLHELPAGELIRAFRLSATHLVLDEYVDLVRQISISHHYFTEGDQARTGSAAFRYVWPSELDLMAQIAGLELAERWSDWDRSPFTNDSRSHVSVWRKP